MTWSAHTLRGVTLSEAQEDRAYWLSKYDEEPRFCEAHEDEELCLDGTTGEHWCPECEYSEANEEAYRYG